MAKKSNPDMSIRSSYSGRLEWNTKLIGIEFGREKPFLCLSGQKSEDSQGVFHVLGFDGVFPWIKESVMLFMFGESISFEDSTLGDIHFSTPSLSHSARCRE